MRGHLHQLQLYDLWGAVSLTPDFDEASSWSNSPSIVRIAFSSQSAGVSHEVRYPSSSFSFKVGR